MKQQSNGNGKSKTAPLGPVEREQRRERIVKAVIASGSYEDDRHLMSHGGGTSGVSGQWTDRRWDVYVREKSSGLLVAYSSTRADFEGSICEFVEDYMT